MLPTGNGYFIWIMDRCTGGNPQAIADRAAAAGLKWVAIKIANGILPYGKLAQNKAVVEALHARGIQAWGWHYVYGYSPVREAEVAAEQVDLTGVDGYIINAEVEYKLEGMSAAARKYMDTLTTRVNKPIGVTSFRFPSLHREFPWKEFLPRVDFNMPQVYWIGANNPGYQLRKAVRESLELAPNLPIIPLGAAFTEWGWNPTGGEILEFRVTASSLKLPGYGWWEWYHAETKNPAWWTASTDAAAGGQPPDDVTPVDDLVFTTFSNLRYRSGPSTSGTILGLLSPYKVYKLEARQGDWGKIAAPTEQWVHLGYIQPARKMFTKYSDLRVRGGPSLNAPIVGYLTKDIIHNLLYTQGAWGRLEGSAERWVHLDYITIL